MRIVLLGVPGAGKGTQAELISKKYNIPHISTGDIFRSHIDKGTPLGLQVCSYIQKGTLVPDDLTISIVKERIEREDCNSGFLLDGFPRNLFQAKLLNYVLGAKEQSIDKVLLIHLPRHMIIERISGRRFCSKCGSSYHIKFNPSKLESLCEVCGGSLAQRIDDKEDIVVERLKAYDDSIKPIVDYYSSQKLLYKVHGTGSMDEVFSCICSILEAAT